MIYPSLRKTGFFSNSRSCHCFWTTTRKLAHEILCISENTRTFLNSQPQKTQLYDTSYFFNLKHQPLLLDACARVYILCVSRDPSSFKYTCVFDASTPIQPHTSPPPRSLSHTFLPLPPFTPSLPTIPRARSPHACWNSVNAPVLLQDARQWIPAPHAKSSPARGAAQRRWRRCSAVLL